jgi:hypothetical protein
MKVVRFSALCTGRFYPRKHSWYSFLLEAESTQGHSVAGKIMSMKKSNDTIGNRTRNLPACSAVPQPTALPRAPILQCTAQKNIKHYYCCQEKRSIKPQGGQLSRQKKFCSQTFNRKSTEKRLLERPSLRWDYNIKIDLNGTDVRV